MKPFMIPVALPRGPEHYWKMAKSFGAKGFALGELAGCTNGVAYDTVRRWVYDMLRQGALKVVGSRKEAGVTKQLYAVAIKALKPPVAQRRDTFEDKRGRQQQQMWTAMRTLQQFSLRELAASASTDRVAVSAGMAKKYVRQLSNAGVLMVVEPVRRGLPGSHGSRGGTWRLRKSADTGPLAPKVFNASIVFDANTLKIVGESEVAHG